MEKIDNTYGWTVAKFNKEIISGYVSRSFVYENTAHTRRKKLHGYY